MNGCIIPGTSIAVDFWQVNKSSGIKFFFLTHLHGDHVVGLTSTWTRPIYCSPLTAQLLQEWYGVRLSVLRPLDVGQSHIVGYCERHCSQAHGEASASGTDRLPALESDGESKDCAEPKKGGGCTSMTVTVIHASHCPGAVMFLFEGHFGKILHTGDFRFHLDMVKEGSLLHKHIGSIDKLYLDNTYCDPECVFPTRTEALAKIVQICKEHRKHDVVLVVRSLGKEELMAAVALALGEFVNVSPKTFSLASSLGFPNVFTTDQPEGRVRAVYTHWVSCSLVRNLNKQKPTIFIQPTALLQGIQGKPYANQPEVFVVPYSDHSSFPELMEFVSKLKPACVVPVVHNKARGPFGVDISRRADVSCFKQFLSKSKTPSARPASVLPPLPHNTQTFPQGHSCLSAERNELEALFPDFQESRLKRKRSPRKKTRRVLLPKGVTYLSDSNDVAEEAAGKAVSLAAPEEDSVTVSVTVSPTSAQVEQEQTAVNTSEVTCQASVTSPYFRNAGKPSHGLQDITDKRGRYSEQSAMQVELSTDVREEADVDCITLSRSAHSAHNVSEQCEGAAVSHVLSNKKADTSANATAGSPPHELGSQVPKKTENHATVTGQKYYAVRSRRLGRSSATECQAKLVHIYNAVFGKKTE